MVSGLTKKLMSTGIIGILALGCFRIAEKEYTSIEKPKPEQKVVYQYQPPVVICPPVFLQPSQPKVYYYPEKIVVGLDTFHFLRSGAVEITAKVGPRGDVAKAVYRTANIYYELVGSRLGEVSVDWGLVWQILRNNNLPLGPDPAYENKTIVYRLYPGKVKVQTGKLKYIPFFNDPKN